ncbi:MAG: 1-(5-phosphoribosyl)-5-[(5-phosphoribosylamino)methylideneamino]imidazole-4-carboxamide isomerase [Bdellovibrionaceae bacterium]|jgi:phosphoribosylformimino-5-aminoimidazole carboxamide ribotide isomerase|nr:1-(5-phosphoribosyl)-5-[(5-phosphoribosylamino)methylideneamino]imidazole-4-carboxamide isomerase [Pseudobdellovibrionaceae bacterium]
MKIYPAIDLINGKCVRLQKGDFTKVTKYIVSPVDVAQQYQSEGAEYLHVVDLDGAKSGGVKQTQVISKLVSSCNLKVQAGGGVRSLKDVQLLLDAGVDKVIIGSLAVKDMELTKAIISQVGAKAITIAFDLFVDEAGVMEIATHGWQSKSDKNFKEVLENYIHQGVDQILCTDISKDGMLVGPNFSLYEQLSKKYPSVCFLASGGMSEASDITQLKEKGVRGVIIGKALYENRFSLSEVIHVN